jgi:hypothetical protein
MLEQRRLEYFLLFGQINDHILFNRFHMKVVVKDCQDLGTVVRSMIGKMEKDLPTRAGGLQAV